MNKKLPKEFSSPSPKGEGRDYCQGSLFKLFVLS